MTRRVDFFIKYRSNFRFEPIKELSSLEMLIEVDEVNGVLENVRLQFDCDIICFSFR